MNKEEKEYWRKIRETRIAQVVQLVAGIYAGRAGGERLNIVDAVIDAKKTLDIIITEVDPLFYMNTEDTIELSESEYDREQEERLNTK